MATMTTSRGQSCCDWPGKKEVRGKRLDSTNHIERRVIKVIQILVFDCLRHKEWNKTATKWQVFNREGRARWEGES